MGDGSYRLLAVLGLMGCGGQGNANPAISHSPVPVALNGILYHGGRVLTARKGSNLYYIWYGDWPDRKARDILTDLARNLGGSSYFNVITSYYDAAGVRVANAVAFRGSAMDSYSQGTTPGNAEIRQIVSRALATTLPTDTNAVYVVLTSQDVRPSTFCTALCGYQDHFLINGSDIKYAWVGNPARCPTRCAPAQPTAGPNGNAGVDAMAATLVHEYINSITNSDRHGWSDSLGRGPASVCGTPELAFPNTYTVVNGALATVKLGKRHYLLTSNWVNAGGGSCVLSYKKPSHSRR